MTDFTKWMVGSIACAVVLCETTDGKAQYLTGTNRSDFVAGTVNGCMLRKDTDPLTAAMPSAVHSEYCRCYANGLADRASMSELKAGDPAVMRPIIQAVDKPCVEAARSSMNRN